MFNAQGRGILFVNPGDRVYAGMVVGQNAKTDDIEVNVCKKKQLTNTRASGSDDALKLSPPRIMSLEPVSYTHLDVYKRQGCCGAGRSAD